MQQDENLQQSETNGSGEAAEDTEQKMNTNADDEDNDEDDRKIFVGNLSWETTSKDLQDYYEKYGEVASASLKIDFETRKSRGFGFVVFKSADSVAKVTAESEHKLGGRVLLCQKANPKSVMKKVFVGRLDPSIKEEEIKEYFEEKFGEVEKIERPNDKTKSFAFIEFKKVSAMKMCLAETEHKIGKYELDVKTAKPPSGGGRGRGGRGGRGGRDFGGYGGYGGYDGYGYGGYGPYDDPYGGYGGYGGGYGGGPWGGAGYGGPRRGYHPYYR